jgi:hypothetical protein
MAIMKYEDFLPQEKQRGGVFGGVDYAGFDTCVVAMNHWLERNPVEVLQIETVTLPNIHAVTEEGSTDTELHTSSHTVWHQFLRLWYSV